MPTVLLERLPLPSLQTYVMCSVVFLASALLYAHHTVINGHITPHIDNSIIEHESVIDHASAAEKWQSLWSDHQHGKSDAATDNEAAEELLPDFDPANMTLPFKNYDANFLWVLCTEGWCVWVSKFLVLLSVVLVVGVELSPSFTIIIYVLILFQL
jgi:hypothetical protein